MRAQFVVVALWFHAAQAHAQPAPLALAQAQTEAREHAPERTTADADLAAAKVRTADAGRRATQDPVISGSYHQALPADAGDRSWSLGLQWTFDISGAWTPRGQAGRATASAAIEARTSALLDLDVEVALAHAELADAQRRVERLAKLVELREIAMRIATRTRETGAGNQLDVDAATLDLRGSQIEVANARGDLAVARARLARLLGRADGAGLTVADVVDMTAIPSVEVTEALVERDPRVRAAAAELLAATQRLAAERRAARPPITLGVEGGRAGSDIPSGAFATMPSLTGTWQEWEVGLQLSVPLPVFDRNRVARAGAHADQLLAEAKLRRVRADVRAGYAEASARLGAAIAAASAAAELPAVIDREVQLLDKGLRAGGIELEAWALQARRLVEAGRTYDGTILGLRRARAAWVRLRQK